MTDPAMVRYFMTKREATDLLWTAARIEPPQREAGQSSVLVLNMGQPVRIDDLARRMIVLAGLDLTGYQDHVLGYQTRRAA